MKNKNIKRKNAQRTGAMILSIIIIVAMVLGMAAPFFTSAFN